MFFINKKLFSFASILLLLSGCSLKNIKNKNDSSIIILYTGSAYGEIKPCGCSEEGNLGGLLRRATYIEKINKENKNIIIVDSGDNFKEASKQAKLKAKIIWRGFKMMDYIAMVPGERDFIYGNNFFSENSENLLISGNLEIKNTKISPYIIKQLPNNKKIAIIGLLDPSLFETIIKHSDIKIQKPIPNLIKIQAEIKRYDVDTVILLVHTDLEKAKQLLKIEGIDIIINGHIDGLEPDNEVIKYKNKILVHPKERGQQLGRLDLTFEGVKLKINNRYIPLSSKIKDHSMFTEIYEEYNKKVEQIFFKTIKRRKKTDISKNFISEKSCKECHHKEHEIWKKTKHARAYKKLTDIKKHHDPECIECHTTGFNEEGGFINETFTPDLTNIQCENCHGPGEEHKKDTQKEYGLNANITCNQCHNKVHSPSFIYSKYWNKIQH